MHRPRLAFLTLAAVLLVGSLARADVKPHPLFSDNMVLQRGVPAPVWGTADPGEEVSVALTQVARETGPGGEGKGIATKTKADQDGKWLVRLPAMSPKNGTYELTIKGKNTVTFKNVVYGEVWICSGQSNMEMAVNGTADAEKAIAAADNRDIRLFTVPKVATTEPQTTVRGRWQVCSPQTVRSFSGVAYFFGRDLQKALGVPVGLIHTSWGGTPAEAWTSKEALNAESELQHYHKQLAERIAKFSPEQAKADNDKAQAKYKDDLAKWEEAAKKARDEGQQPPRRPQPPRPPQDPAKSPNSPSTLYNGMIAPLLPYAIKGAIWYQGESNAGRAVEYRTLFATMIEDWRKRFGVGDFPFLFVQLAPYEPGGGGWPMLWEAQLLTVKKVPNTGMAVITDVGERRDIHPKKKEPVGARLALAALALGYGKKVEYSGPLYKAHHLEGNQMVLTFNHTGAGLEARGGELKGFEIAGEDGKFVPARAKIRGDTVVVSSDKAEQPAAVRYDWAPFPEGNLWNKDGLPASPFRTNVTPPVTFEK